ncbi:cytoplasmic dynein 2 heavy chain 1-like [Limulus polyphemus]|uniref:Cytoplasmic dynein 2 heavy chain 1-like n=1 Tax=Limulus polyphemus TaxID=6850 RepID=A0ABM1RWN0_LIMPO|nr:cytoplasmic dynein 2 heavy chain 1-like [Limulus polyphemus]
MPSGDSRKDFILTSIGDFFSLSMDENTLNQLFNAKELNNFLDEQDCHILSTQVEGQKDEKEIYFMNKVEPKGTDDRILIFFKIRPDVITPDNLHSNIFITSMIDSPITALYHSVQKIFAPVLLKNERWSPSFNPKLQSLLGELEAGLGSMVRKSDKADLEVGEREENNLAGILSPNDEFTFWNDRARLAPGRAEKERSAHFHSLFEPLQKSFETLETVPLVECLDILELAFSVLDDVWKQEEYTPAFQQSRMSHLMDIIGK